MAQTQSQANQADFGWGEDEEIVTSPGFLPRSFRELLQKANVATQDDVNSMGSSYAGLQAQFDQLRADVQRQIDELRPQVEPAHANARGATPPPRK